MTPTPAELREAAILLRNWFIQSSAFPDDKDEAIYTLATHYLSNFPADGANPTHAELREAALRLHNLVRFCSDEVKKDVDLFLSHFPADSAIPITADWLREEWPAINYNGEIRIDGATGRFCLWPKDGLHWTHAGNTIATLTTRQQFRTLAGLLGIEPKRKETV